MKQKEAGWHQLESGGVMMNQLERSGASETIPGKYR